MQGIGDPQTFELSQVVEKNSKTGIFTNRRLIMIKDGYLNYFSNVPPDYKSHESNVIAMTKQLPKSSIQIRSIHGVKLESAKSKTLIITFYPRFLIDRQQLRKSISSKLVRQPTKDNESQQSQQWVFIFPSVMKCRLWYASLIKLKQYFVKNQDKYEKFQEYMANFDADIRKSLPQNSSGGHGAAVRRSAPNLAPNSPQKEKSPQKYKLDQKSGIFEIQQAAEEYDDDPTPKAKIQQLNNTTLNSTALNNTTINNNKTETQGKTEPKVVKEEKAERSEVEDEERIQAENWKQIQKVREEERKKAEDQAHTLQEQLSKREQELKKMEKELSATQKAQAELESKLREEKERREEEERMRQILEREKKEEEQYRRLRQSIRQSPPLLEQTPASPPEADQAQRITYKQQSMQTEYQRQIIDVLEGGMKAPQRGSRSSFRSDFSLSPIANERESLLFRNTISYLSEVKVAPKEDLQQYDYYWQLGRIYRTQQPKEKVGRQLALVDFVRKASKKAASLVQDYIDLHKPKQSLVVDRSMFEIEIVCERGRLMTTAQGQQLVYPNEAHQRLKQFYKVHQKVSQKILCILKKQPEYPLRAPFCCLVEYKGYSALAKLMPALENQNSLHPHQLKALGQNIPLHRFNFNDFNCHGSTYTLMQPHSPFKISLTDNISLLQPTKNFDFLTVNRRAGLSISVDKLTQDTENTELYKEERLQIIQLLSNCRQLKKIMKTHVPFADPEHQLQFFHHFLRNPTQVMELRVAREVNLSGILLYYIQRLLGIKFQEMFNADQDEQSFIIIPVIRQFPLLTLDVSLFAYNFHKYCEEKKLQTARKALSYLKYLLEDYAEVMFEDVHFQIHLGNFTEALEKIQAALELISVHDPRRLKGLQLKAQCQQALNRPSDALATLKKLLEHTQYMYGPSDHLVEVYFAIADCLSRQHLIQPLVQVYRSILQHSPNHRERVFIDFSTTLLQHSHIDPHLLLDFLHKELPNQVESPNPTVQHLLGQLYLTAGNQTKALTAYTQAFNSLLISPKDYRILAQVFARIFQCSSSGKEKKSVHRQLMGAATAQFAVSEQAKAVNTLVCEWLTEGMSDRQRDAVIEALTGQGVQECQPRLLEWNWLQSLMRRMSKSEHCSSEEKTTLMWSIEADRLSECLILRNNPNFISL